MTADRILSGWKEIAAYLGISIKTARKLYKKSGLPVRVDGLAYSSTDSLRKWCSNRIILSRSDEDRSFHVTE